VPSVTTLFFRSTRNQCGYCTPILATVRLYRILQLAVFYSCPYTITSIRPVDVGIKDIMPSVMTPSFRSTRNQRRNCSPILVTVCLYCIFQLAVFVCCPFTRTPSDDTGIQDIVPSVPTLPFRSTGNQRCNCTPILATVRLYRIHQLAVFDCGPCTRASRRCSVDAGIQDIVPPFQTLVSRSTRN
jgi:hypothetical protein